MLGFAMRAGKVIFGTDTVCKKMSAPGAVKLVIVASDASSATKKKLVTKSEFYGIQALVAQIDSSELGRLLGKTFSACVIGITDSKFAEEISKAHSENVDGQREQTTQRKEVSDIGNR